MSQDRCLEAISHKRPCLTVKGMFFIIQSFVAFSSFLLVFEAIYMLAYKLRSDVCNVFLLSLSPILLDLVESGSLHGVSDVHTEPRPAEYGSGPFLSGADDQAAGTRAG